MKTRLAVAFAIVFVLLMGIVQGAAAQTGCFPDTNGHWAETFICWLKDNGIVSGYGDGTYRPENQVTRGEMAVYAKNVADYSTDAAQTMADTAEANAIAEAEALVDVPPRTGYILVNGGRSDWLPELGASSSLIYMQHNVNQLIVQRSAPGSETIVNSPYLPVALYGKRLQLAGVELCYSAAAEAYLDRVAITTTLDVSEAGTNMAWLLADYTDRKEPACRYYALPAPVTLQTETSVALDASIAWTVADAAIALGRTTFVLEATDTDAASPD